MNRHRRSLTILLLIAAVVAVAILFKPGEPVFRGQPESYWITNIVYSGPSEQIEQWHNFGPEGVHLLTKYLDSGSGGQNTYRRFYRRYAPKIPAVMGKFLPTPVEDRGTRMCVLSLLTQLSYRDTNTAFLAEASIARTMGDEDRGLRQIAVGSYEGIFSRQGFKEELFLRIGLKKKHARLRQFLRLAEDDDHWVRGNAANTLAYFPEEAAAVGPVLIKVLPEPHPHIQLNIAQSLVRVDREAALKAGVAAIAAEHLRQPEQRFTNQALQRWSGWEISRQAAEVLGELHDEPAISLPALVEGVGSTNREIAIASFRAMTKFKEHTEQTLPVLRKAAIERTDIPNWIKAELNKIDPVGKVAK